MVNIVKAAAKAGKTQSRKSKVTAELINRAKAGDAKARSFVQDMYNKAVTPDPQKTVVASPDAFGGGSPDIKQSRKEFQQEQGLPVESPAQVRKLDVEKSKRIADAFEELTHNPADPKVRSSYDAMIRETEAQYQKLLDSGVKFEYWRGQGEPYKNSKEMLHDLRENKTLKVLATEGNFGQKNITPQELAENPLLARTKFNDANGQPLLANDVFRAVHDAFGHAEEGYSFGAVGEDGAWASHIKMYSPEARRAVTTETRGQNSWVNFGKQLRRPDGTIPQRGDVDFIPPQDRPFGEQKVGLLPEEFSMDEYVSLWKDPKFRDRAKKVGFGAATMYGLTNPSEAEGSTIWTSLRQVAKRNYETLGDAGVIAKVDPNAMASEFDSPKNFFERSLSDKPKVQQTARTELDKMVDMSVDLSEPNLLDKKSFDLAEHEGEGVILTMADRLAAGQQVKGINGIEFVHPETGLPDPVDLHGGQDWMRDPKNAEAYRIWAGDQGASSTVTNQAIRLEDLTGERALLAPWLMAKSGVDYAVPTAEVMIKYARQTMSPADIKRADKLIRNAYPEFKGLKNPESITVLKDIGGDNRKLIQQSMNDSHGDSKYRKALPKELQTFFTDRGNISLPQARISVTDSAQMGDPKYGLRNIGEVHPEKGVVPSDGTTYPRASSGEYKGTLEAGTDVGQVTQFNKFSKERGIDPNNPKAMDKHLWKLMKGEVGEGGLREFIITPELIDALNKGGKKIPPKNARKAANHINRQKEKGFAVDWKYLSGLGVTSTAAFGLTAIIASPEVQASIFTSGLKAALKNIPDGKNSPQQWKGLISKQKGAAGKEINAMDWDKLGNKGVTKEQIEDFIDAEAPRIVMTEKKSAYGTPAEEQKVPEGLLEEEMARSMSQGNTQDSLSELLQGMQKTNRDYFYDLAIKKGEKDYKAILKNRKYDLEQDYVKNEPEYARKVKEKIDHMESLTPEEWTIEQMEIPMTSSSALIPDGERNRFAQSLLQDNKDMLKERTSAFTAEDRAEIRESYLDENADEYGNPPDGKMQYEDMTLEGGEEYQEMYFNLETPLDEKPFVAFKGTPNLKKTFDTKEEAETYVRQQLEGENDQQTINKYVANTEDTHVAFKGDAYREETFPTREEAEAYVRSETEKVYDQPLSQEDVDFRIRELPKNDGNIYGTAYPEHPSGQQPNNMAWVRADVRRGEQGERLLNILEMQSDTDKKTAPKALKKMLPKNWREGILNQVLEKAQADGFDGVTFAKDFKQVDTIENWGATEYEDVTYITNSFGERKRVDSDSEFYGASNINELLGDAADEFDGAKSNFKFIQRKLDKIGKQRDDLNELYTNEEITEEAYNTRLDDLLDEKLDTDDALADYKKNLEDASGKLERAKVMKDSGWQVEHVQGEEVFQGSEGMERVVDQYTKEFPEIAKGITGEDVGVMRTGQPSKWEAYDVDAPDNVKTFDTEAEAEAWADNIMNTDGAAEYVSIKETGGFRTEHDLNYIPLKNTDGTPKKLRESKFWQAAPVVGATGLGAALMGGSDKTYAGEADLTAQANTDAIHDLQQKALDSIYTDGINDLTEYKRAYMQGKVNPDQYKWVIDQEVPEEQKTITQFEERNQNPENFPYIQNEDGSRSSHKMAAEVDENGNWTAFPTIVMMPDGNLKEFDDVREAEQYNRSIGNVKEFGQDESAALSYAEGGYKSEALKNYNPENSVDGVVRPHEAIAQSNEEETQQMLKPLTEKVSQAPEEEQGLLYTPPEQMPEGAMSREEGYAKELDKQSFMGKAERLMGSADVGMTVASTMAQQSAAGIGGMLVSDLHKAADMLNSLGFTKAAEKLRPSESASQYIEGSLDDDAPWMPKSEEGDRQLQELGKTIEQVGSLMNKHGGAEVMQAQDEGGEWAYKWGTENISPEFGAMYGTLVSKIHELIP